MGNANTYDWAKIIEENRSALSAALSEACEKAVRSAKDEFIVYIWSDGKPKIVRNDGNTCLDDEDRLREIQSFSFKDWEPLDWYGETAAMLDALKDVMDEDEIAQLNNAIATDELDDCEQIEWIKENAPTAYDNVYEWAVERVTSDGGWYDGMISSAIIDARNEALKNERIHREYIADMRKMKEYRKTYGLTEEELEALQNADD